MWGGSATGGAGVLSSSDAWAVAGWAASSSSISPGHSSSGAVKLLGWSFGGSEAALRLYSSTAFSGGWVNGGDDVVSITEVPTRWCITGVEYGDAIVFVFDCLFAPELEDGGWELDVVSESRHQGVKGLVLPDVVGGIMALVVTDEQHYRIGRTCAGDGLLRSGWESTSASKGECHKQDKEWGARHGMQLGGPPTP